MTSATYPTLWRPPPLFGSRTRQRAAVLGAGAYLVWALWDLNVDLERMLAGFGRALNILVRMFPPDFGRWQLLLDGMVESVQIAFAATLLGALVSIPLALAAARNLAPRLIYVVARGFFVVGRTLHEVIIAIFCVKLFGFGPIAGLLTLAFASAIFLGKMLAEDIENVKLGPVEAVRATGAGFGQVVVYSIVPQVLARTVGMLIYRLDANVRHSTVIGIVGAGGIGLYLANEIAQAEWPQVAFLILMILATVATIDWLSGKIRFAVIGTRGRTA